MSETKHVRSRQPQQKVVNSSDVVLSTDDANERDEDVRYRHDRVQMAFMIVTAVLYLVHTLRAYIPESLQANSTFWAKLQIRPITRVYTSDLRPSTVIEGLLLRLAENWQTFSLLYVLSYIPRRTNLGYLYRNPKIFDSFVCVLLIGAVSLQNVSRWSVAPEVSCGCLCFSFVLLLVVCRVVAVRLFNHEHKFQTVDLLIMRYFVLNSLFLYTTSIAYSTMCASMECLGVHRDPDATVPTSIGTCTTVGYLMILSYLVIYSLLDRFVYEEVGRSIWAPYLFLAYVFICPPWRQLSSLNSDSATHRINDSLLWVLFSLTILMICIRVYLQVSRQRRSTKKVRISSHIEQVVTDPVFHSE